MLNFFKEKNGINNYDRYISKNYIISNYIYIKYIYIYIYIKILKNKENFC